MSKRHNQGQVAALKRLADMARVAFAANQDAKRCKTNFVGGMGECLACGADQGIACRADLYALAVGE